MRTIRDPKTKKRYCILERHPVESKKPLSWDVDVTPTKVRVFYRCRCGTINQIKRDIPDDVLFLPDCLVCPTCKIGIYVYLKDWKGKGAIMKKAVARRRA